MRSIFLFAILLFSITGAKAQSAEFINDYITRFRDIAINEMKRTGVPASIKLAQGIHESMAGQSDLVSRSNNHFGIKCKSNWKGESVSHTDDAPDECFRKYADPEESYKDHSDFLRNNQRYSFLFNLDPADYEAWAKGLKKAGYATNPRYPQLIIKLIDDYNLQHFSLIAMGKVADDKQRWVVMDESSRNKNVLTTPMLHKEKISVQHVNTINQYPADVFKINSTKVIFAKKGTSFLSVAQQHNISLSKLFEYNDGMKEMSIVPFDQLIFLQRKRKTGHQDHHIVITGETTFNIAQQHGIRLENLLSLNHLEEGMIPAPGERIYLRSKAPAVPKLLNESLAVNHYSYKEGSNKNINSTISTVSSKSVIHNVKPKEGLYAIGRQYGVTVNELLEWNNLKSEALQVGQQIKILR